MPGPERLKRALVGVVAMLCLHLALNRPAAAHPMPNTLVLLRLQERSIAGEARIPLWELESALGHPVPVIDRSDIRDYFVRHIRANAAQQAWQTRVSRLDVAVDRDPVSGRVYQEVIVAFTLTPPDPTLLRHFTFNDDAIVHQVVTHQIVVFLQSDWHNGILADDAARPLGTIGLDVRSGAIAPLQVDLADGSRLTGTLAMVRLGMRHIREGLDHILFLLTLLLVAPLTVDGGRWTSWQGFRYTLKRFLTISLAFTLGHSVTLLIGSLNWLAFDSQWIEVMIAVSILLSAINAIRPVFYRREALVAGGFGLIHGLAFSASLSGLQLDLGSKLLSVLGFNLGIELMQLTVMLMAFPVLVLSRWPVYRGIRITTAVLTILLSLAWIAARMPARLL